MELKKSKKANLENKRTMFLEIGLIVALGVVLMAFIGSNSVKPSNQFVNNGPTIDVDVVIPPTFPSEPPKPLPPLPKVIEFITLVPNNVEIAEPFEFETTDIDINTLIYAKANYTPEKSIVDEFDSTFVVVEKMPVFPGGEPALLHWIANNVKYPAKAADMGLQGKVIVSFVVDKNGKAVDAKVIRGVDPLLDNEALRVVNSLPTWQPGKQREKPVRVSFSMPINFQLQQ